MELRCVRMSFLYIVIYFTSISNGNLTMSLYLKCSFWQIRDKTICTTCADQLLNREKGLIWWGEFANRLKISNYGHAFMHYILCTKVSKYNFFSLPDYSKFENVLLVRQPVWCNVENINNSGTFSAS